MDSGFYDDDRFATCGRLQIGYLWGCIAIRPMSSIWLRTPPIGKLSRKILMIGKAWKILISFASSVGEKKRRTIFSTLCEHNEQYSLDRLCRDMVIITNLGKGKPIDTMMTCRNSLIIYSLPKSSIYSQNIHPFSLIRSTNHENSRINPFIRC